jgi:hypothetical protein
MSCDIINKSVYDNMKSKLPREIELLFPSHIVTLIYKFVPHAAPAVKMSPSLQSELIKLQKMNLQGINSMYMRDFIDFLLE